MTIALASLTSCGGASFTGDPSDGDGGNGSGSGGDGSAGDGSGGDGSAGDGAGGEGGTAMGGTAGFPGTGGSGGFPPPALMCGEPAHCFAVVDMGHPCFSPDCSPPIAASAEDLSKNPCLVRWEDRFLPRPDDCPPPTGGTPCPAICAQQPNCVMPQCNNGHCELEVVFNVPECPPAGTGGGPSVPDCQELGLRRRTSMLEAQKCFPGEDVIQCTGEVLVADECGCEVPLNDYLTDAVAAAQEAAREFHDAGCTIACGRPCFYAERAICSADFGICVWPN